MENEKAMISVTTAGAFADALEDWIIKNECNPTTPEEWNRCLSDLFKSGILQPVATIDKAEVSEVKDQIKKNFNAEEF